MTDNYIICKRCIMDTSDPGIEFDENGLCNRCRNYYVRIKSDLHYDEDGKQKLNAMVDKIKRDGKNKEYDCIIGVSGGVDSTTVAYYVKRLGLRPLAIHVDNGWDPEFAIRNVEKILKVLNIDLRTYVLDWEVFKDLQLSFLKASVPNCEIPTDHAITALLYRTAAENKIPYIISGGNVVTEAIMGKWGYRHADYKHIKGIHKKFGSTSLKNYPHLNLFDWAYFTFVKGIKFIPILNYIRYVSKDAKELITKELGWHDYGIKHFESIYTRFFQAYIQPTKFGFDKRKAHLSNLICSDQMTREEAMEEMEHDPYPTKELLKEDKEYVIKKLGLTEEEFEELMSRPVEAHLDYPNNNFFYEKLDFIVKLAHKKATHNE